MIVTDKPEYLNDFEDVVRLFYPEYKREEPFAHEISCLLNDDGQSDLTVQTSIDGLTREGRFKVPRDSVILFDRFAKRYAKTVLYDAISALTGRTFPWGSMTGIRPVRVGEMLIAEGECDVGRALKENFRVSDQYAERVAQILEFQEGVYSTGEKDVAFYIHVPICPSRCYYCSFVSVLADRCKVIDDYVEKLAEDIRLTAEILKEGGYNVTSVYVGGGTPTVLTAEQLEQVLRALPRYGCEFTVEAGRPDTVTRQKLEVMISAGVTRISVNPQTFSDATLQRIGRNHTSKDIELAYGLARQFPMDVNMDLIAGLDGETVDDFRSSVQKTLELCPDNITVHTLCKKRGSDVQTKELDFRGSESKVYEMTELAHEMLDKAGYRPYYLYRQKNMLAGLQNIGYSMDGKQCKNNIDTMEEHAHVAACGSGAISKRLFERGYIERLAQMKPIEIYLERFDEFIEKKRKLFLRPTN